MKALCYRQYGSPEVLQIVQMLIPEPKVDEVLIKVHAASVNPADWRFRKGTFKFGMPLRFPFIPGNDVAGTIIRTGNPTSLLKVGEPVFAMTPLQEGGACSEFMVVRETLLAQAPAKISLSAAAAIPLAALTALQGLRNKANLKPGQNLLVVGGSGGVGHFAVQIGKAFGANVAAVSSSKNREFLLSLGAEEALDYNDLSMYDGPKKYDVIFDTVAKDRFDRWRNLMKPQDCVVTVNPVIGNILPVFVTKMLGVAHLFSFFVEPNRSDLLYLKDLIDSLLLRPILQRTFDLEDAAEAHRISEAGHVCGKLIIRVSS